jgi:hypothetical protein
MRRQRTLLSAVIAAAGMVALYRGHVRPWMYTWGATESEVGAVLPGDELVSPDTPRTTRAVTIDAPIDAVWPWLAQIGEDRAGFYSYDWLERAVGAAIHNSKELHPEWQHLGVGDSVWLARRYGAVARQVVAAIEPNSHLVLMSADDYARVQQGDKATGSWSFHVRRTGSWTRLVARGSGGAVGHAVFDIPHFVMEQKMMRGIRDRAQQRGQADEVFVRPSTDSRKVHAAR